MAEDCMPHTTGPTVTTNNKIRLKILTPTRGICVYPRLVLILANIRHFVAPQNLCLIVAIQMSLDQRCQFADGQHYMPIWMLHEICSINFGDVCSIDTLPGKGLNVQAFRTSIFENAGAA